MINTLLGMAIDIRHQRPLLGNIMGGLSGREPGRCGRTAGLPVDLPIIGMGGIVG